jgi:hypothetical protein
MTKRIYDKYGMFDHKNPHAVLISDRLTRAIRAAFETAVSIGLDLNDVLLLTIQISTSVGSSALLENAVMMHRKEKEACSQT